MAITASEVLTIFDPIMLSIKAKLDSEFELNRLKGADYATVYAKALEFALQQTVALILGTDQRALISAQVLETNAKTALTDQQKANLLLEATNIPKQGAILDKELLIKTQQVLKSEAEIALINKQIDIATQDILVKQQEVLKSTAEVGTLNAKLLNIPKEGQLIDSQINKANIENLLALQQKENLILEGVNIPKQGNLLDKEAIKMIAETNLIPKQSELIDAQIVKLLRENTLLEKQIILMIKQGDNLTIEGANLTKTGLDIDAGIDLKKAELLVKAREPELISAQAEQALANATNARANAGAIGAEQVTKILKVATDSWGTHQTTTKGVGSAFTSEACNEYATTALDLIWRQ